MVNQYLSEGSGPSNVSEDTSESTVEINIKTLESQIYTFQVDKNMLVSLFKEKIADQTGVPVGQQRLIFRGKVLKDDHPLSEYHLENGHTLHLVVRQPSQPHTSSGTSSAEPHASSGNEAGGAPRSRIGQVSHSVLLGTFNVGDQGDGMAPDLSRVIGAVLNSIGIGSQATSNGNMPSTTPNNPGQSSQGNETEGLHGNANGQTQGGNNAQSGRTFSSQPFQNFPQFLQTPLAAAGASPFLSLNTPIPDALNTISEFMNRMERALSQNGGYQQNISAPNPGDLPRVNLPSTAQGLPTPEALGIVLRNAERLLSSHAASALSHIAGRLEQEVASSDPTARGQIQTESIEVGLAMQHLGALLLELGRTIWTLRMGQSPGEAVVNAGPAVYISPSGPNPIMVQAVLQPIPYQTSSPFGASVPPGNFGPVGIGSAPRNVHIHIHAGTSLSALGARASNGEGVQGEHRNGPGSGDSGAARVLPVRNIIAPTIPSSQGGITISSAPRPGLGVSIPRRASDSSLSSIAAELNSQIRNFVGNTQGNDVVQSGQGVPNVQNSSAGVGSGNNTGNEQPSDLVVNGIQQPNASVPGCTSENEVQKASGSVPPSRDDSNFQARDSLPSVQDPVRSEEDKGNASQTAAKQDVTEGAKAVPLGLGLGMLERKRPGRQQKPPQKNGDGGNTSTSSNQNQQVVSGQQLLQSLATRSTAGSRLSTSDTPARPTAPTVGQIRDGRSLGGQGSGGQVDLGSMMSQVLQSPALNGLLSGVSEQTGVGSPDALRNMLQNFTQSPQMMNVVSQITEQVDTQDFENMFAGLGGGQGGGIDMSRMFEQMMPIASRALGGGPSPAQPPSVMGSHPLFNERNLNIDDNEIDLQQVVQRIGQLNAPGDIFQAVVENSVQLSGREGGSQELVDELCRDEGLSSEYAEILRRDIRQRLERESGHDNC